MPHGPGKPISAIPSKLPTIHIQNADMTYLWLCRSIGDAGPILPKPIPPRTLIQIRNQRVRGARRRERYSVQ